LLLVRNNAKHKEHPMSNKAKHPKPSKKTGSKQRPTKGKKETTMAMSQPDPVQPNVEPVFATGGQPKPARKPSLLDFAVRVLRDSNEPLGTKEMVAKIIGAGWWNTKGRTPEATLYSAIIREIGCRDGKTRFVKIGRGRFALTQEAKENPEK
jgi:hypothetical protein